MKKKILLVPLCLCFTYLTGQTKLPNIALNTVQGKVIQSDEFLRDSIPVVIAFWSTVCKPCIEELDAIAENWVKWQKEVRFKVIAISVDDVRSMAKVPAFVATNAWPFAIILDKNQEAKRALNVSTIPSLFICDAKGNIVYSHVGFNPGAEYKLIEVLKKCR